MQLTRQSLMWLSCTYRLLQQFDVSIYSETSNNGLSERRTTSVPRTNSMPSIALPIEIVHLEPPSSGYLSTPDNDSQRAPKGQQSVQNNLQKRTETKTASINHKNTIKFLTFVTQIVCPLLCFVDFCPCRECFDRDLLIQLLVGHTPLHRNILTSSRLGVWPVSQPLR